MLKCSFQQDGVKTVRMITVQRITGMASIILKTKITIIFVTISLRVGILATLLRVLESPNVLFIAIVFVGGCRKKIIRIGRTISATATAISSARLFGMIA